MGERAMKGEAILLVFAACFLLTATGSEAKAWYAYHVHYGGGYGYRGGYAYGGYHPYYGGYYSPYLYAPRYSAGYHYGGYGGIHYGYVRRW
jgi:hypothetical protein